MVKNLTVALDERSYRKARIAAAQRGISVSALVRDFFNSLGSATDTDPAPPRVPSMVELLGSESVAEIDLEIPEMTEGPRSADVS
jgi:hypothetical protein